MKTVEIKIENLKCNGCASSIKKGLLKFDEVSKVNVDIENSVIEIFFEGNNSNTDDYKLKLAKMGYPETGNNNTFLAAKSFVSCAIGRVSNNVS